MKPGFVSMLILLIALCASSFAQNIKKQAEKAFDELEASQTELTEGKHTLWFFNAVDGTPIEHGRITVEKAGTFETDALGKVKFPILEDGIYTVKFEKEGFITTPIRLEVAAGTIFDSPRYSISPVMKLEYVRIILDWGKKPKDLDAHLLKEGSYHISYHDMITADDGSARLDRDDTESYGPETITITRVDNTARYLFFVHDYSHRHKENSNKLAGSKARVTIYANGKLMHVYQVPKDLHMNTWKVFEIQDGKFVKL